jgi:hypothetical protein
MAGLNIEVLMTAFVLLAGLLLGCEAEPDRPFGGGVAGDGGGEDSGATGDGGGTVDDGVSPVITSVVAEFYTPPNFETVLQVYIYWTDPQEDIKGGSVIYSIRGSDGASDEGALPIGGSEARMDDTVEGSPVFFWVAGVDTSADYEVDVMLKDMSGNDSQVVSASVQ